MKRVLHIGSVSPHSSNRLALQLQYVAGSWDADVLHLTADAPAWPSFNSADPVVFRKAKSLLRILISRMVIALRLMRSDADLLHAHENASLWAAAFWTTVLRRPAVWDPHDYFHERLRRRKWLLGRYNIKEFLERLLVRRSVPVLVVSHGMEEQFRRMYPAARIEVIYNYSSEAGQASSARTPSTDGTIRVVYPGLVKPMRLEPALIESLGKLSNIRFDVYGADAEESYARELAEVIRIERIDNVALKGRFSSSGIGSILALYDFAVFPFPVTGMNLDFCLPNKFYQCIEAGLPIITSDMQEMGELVRHYGLGHVFPSQRYDELVMFLRSFDVSGTAYADMLRGVAEYRGNHIRRAEQRALLLGVYEAAVESKR